MLSWLKKVTGSPQSEVSFKSRVAEFWKWYAHEAGRLFDTIEAGRCADLATEIGAKVDEMTPRFAWVFGPGKNGDGHSLTLSGEGALHVQLLAQYWLRQAPTLPHWTFYDSRQPGTREKMIFNFDNQKFDGLEFWLSPTVDLDESKVDITVWHPMFPHMDEQTRWSVLFVFLDEAMGEYGTQQRIGEIKLEDTCLSDAIPLQELPAYVKKLEQEHDWNPHPPGLTYSIYQLPETHDRFPRGDIIIGTTANMRLVNEYLEAEGKLADPLAGTGARYAYVSFNANYLPKGKESAARGEIEDALAAALEVEANGRVIGGALGTQRAYIDLLLFDLDDSLNLIKETAQDLNLPSGTEINFFAHKHRGHRVVL